MSDSEKEIENQILEAGEKLVDPPSSLDELLPLLDVSSLHYSLFPAMLTVCMSSVLDFSICVLALDMRLCAC